MRVVYYCISFLDASLYCILCYVEINSCGGGTLLEA